MVLAACIAFFVIIATVITAFGYSHFVRPASILDQLSTVSATGEKNVYLDPTVQAKPPNPLAKLLVAIGDMLPYSPAGIGLIKRELATAGFRAGYAVSVYIGIKIILCAVLGLLAFTMREQATDNPILRLVFPIAGAGIGFLGPGFVLGRLSARRQEQIRLALPDVLDLLVISSEAGCALDKAILNVSREFKTFHPAISEELALVNMEMLAGGSRIDALRNLARRTGEDQLKKLVAILVQTDRFGTSVAEALRTQSEFLRVRRRQEAEERAGKVGVKLIFPIFFFCMPALTIIVAGPGFLQLFKHLLPTMAGLK